MMNFLSWSLNLILIWESLYERNSYDRLRPELPEYLRGYFDAAIWAQQCINGGNILEEMLTVPVLEELQQYFKIQGFFFGSGTYFFYYGFGV